MKIPSTFNLAGVRWRVFEIDGLGAMGYCDPATAVIRLDKGLPAQIKAATFCHELVHAIKDTMGLREHDEKEVDAFGHLLHQFINTSKP